MDRSKMGRPKSKEPTKNKSINFRVTDTELKSAQEICNRWDSLLKASMYFNFHSRASLPVNPIAKE